MNNSPLKNNSRCWFLPSVLLLGGISLLSPLACKSEPQVGDGIQGASCSNQTDCGSGLFCSTNGTCLAQCASCGAACEDTDQCPEGQYCSSAKTCQRECEPGTEDVACGFAKTCSDDGKCVAKDSIIIGQGGGTGDGDGDGDNVDCIDLTVDFAPQIPNVVLLIDRSGSMNAGVGFGAAVQQAIDDEVYEPWDCINEDWRWNVVRNVLLHPERGVIKPLEDQVRFGMALYSSLNGRAVNNGGWSIDPAKTCPILDEVDLAFGNQEAMLAEFPCDDYTDDTPTRESLTAVAEKLAALDVDGPKVIVLGTDGAPDTCECADWNASQGRPQSCREDLGANDVEYEGQMYNVAQYEQILVTLEAQRIYQELGIIVEVINLNAPRTMNDSDPQTALANHLDSVALYGGSQSGKALDGFDPVGIASAFQSIIDGVRSCAIDLDGRIAPGKESTGTVRLDMDPTAGIEFETLSLNDENGWRVNTPTQIELLGDACETIKSGDHEIDIKFPCGSFEIIK